MAGRARAVSYESRSRHRPKTQSDNVTTGACRRAQSLVILVLPLSYHEASALRCGPSYSSPPVGTARN